MLPLKKRLKQLLSIIGITQNEINKNCFTYFKFSPLNSLSKNFVNCSRPTGSLRSSRKLKLHRFTRFDEMSLLKKEKFCHDFMKEQNYLQTYAFFSASHNSVFSEIHGFGRSGGDRKKSNS